ncbi:MAG: hypothetical protein J6B77_05495, partial [Clostridia bacterium]|nr:hypothetical protein [Clostridia bacterium]
MASIKLDLSKQMKKIKPLHAGGQPPVSSSARDTYFHYLTEAGIPYSRLHDVGGSFGGGKYVDIPMIFRDFDADVNDPASYDFTFTDLLLEHLANANVEPYYRLGITIENAARVKPYYTAPPKDYKKWAEICEHIIRHYTEGWADGYRHRITYWEIWNEPDNGRQMWSGTFEDYYRLYDVTAKHLKTCFGDRIKVGGFASCGFYGVAGGNDPFNMSEQAYQKFIDFFHGFMQYVKAHGSPIDFFSWHSYAPTMNTIRMDKWVGEQLEAYGYGHIESHLNEWNPFEEEAGNGHHAAEVASTILALQDGRTDVACIYDMRISGPDYSSFFDVKTKLPHQTYYAFVAFNTLYRLGTQVEAISDTEGVFAVAATDGKRHALMISNISGKNHTLAIEGADLSAARFSYIDDYRMLSWAPNAKELKNNSVVLIEW